MTDHERELLIDALAMLRHWVSGKADNWDGSTKGQARVLIRQIEEHLKG